MANGNSSVFIHDVQALEIKKIVKRTLIFALEKKRNEMKRQNVSGSDLKPQLTRPEN